MAKSGGERVEIRSASKIYGSVRALDDVSLDIAAQEFVSLLGPSGSGKTTLLGILGGFVQPSAGTILFGGRDVTFTPPHKRDIGIVFQNYALFPHMSVGENVAFPLRARRLPKSTYAERVRAALAMVDLAGYEERGIGQLSGGQRQRVALARAMIFEPRLILMDEPLSALDKQLRETMQIELRQLHKRLGATIIYVTHDQREALTMSDRVAILKDGKLVQIDKPSRLHDHPADAFVASFIGEAPIRTARPLPPLRRPRPRDPDREAPDRGRRRSARAQPLLGPRHRHRLPGREPARLSRARRRHPAQPAPAQPFRGDEPHSARRRARRHQPPPAGHHHRAEGSPLTVRTPSDPPDHQRSRQPWPSKISRFSHSTSSAR